MKSIKCKLENRIEGSLHNRLNKEYYNKLKYGCCVDLTHKLKVELREKCNDVFFKVSEELYWNTLRLIK